MRQREAAIAVDRLSSCCCRRCCCVSMRPLGGNSPREHRPSPTTAISSRRWPRSTSSRPRTGSSGSCCWMAIERRPRSSLFRPRPLLRLLLLLVLLLLLLRSPLPLLLLLLLLPLFRRRSCSRRLKSQQYWPRFLRRRLHQPQVPLTSPTSPGRIPAIPSGNGARPRRRGQRRPLLLLFLPLPLLLPFPFFPTRTI